MQILMRMLPAGLALLACAVSLSACSPTYDWREVRGADAPYSVLLPAKPSTLSQAIDLDGEKVTMTMTAAEVNGVTFAVGSATLNDSAKALQGMQTMKSALIKNIAGTIKLEKNSHDRAAQLSSIEIEAIGSPSASSKGQPVQLNARFIAKENRVYQVVAVGPQNAMIREAIDTFLPSFKLN
jgi:hypothetical protein